jgi:hypothetical protein
MNKTYIFAAAFLATLVCGCSSDKTSPPVLVAGKSTSSTELQPALVPAAVKTVGYDYYGLTNLKTLPMNGHVNGQSEKASQETKLVSVDTDSATYEQKVTGSFAQTSTIRATKEGVFTISVNGQEQDKPQLELPADPKPGFSWQIHAKFDDQRGGHIILSSTDKIVGVQKIKVGNQTYDALLITETGQMHQGNTVYDLNSKKWVAKGIGQVKVDLISKTGTGAPTNITLEVAP